MGQVQILSTGVTKVQKEADFCQVQVATMTSSVKQGGLVWAMLKPRTLHHTLFSSRSNRTVEGLADGDPAETISRSSCNQCELGGLGHPTSLPWASVSTHEMGVPAPPLLGTVIKNKRNHSWLNIIKYSANTDLYGTLPNGFLIWYIKLTCLASLKIPSDDG